MGRRGWRTWLNTGVLLCACARAPELEQVEAPQAPEEVAAAPSAPQTPPLAESPPDTKPLPPSEQGKPPVVEACGEVERTLLGELQKGEQLLDASSQGRVVVLGSTGNLRVQDTVSGRITALAGRVEGFTRDERWMLFSLWQNGAPGPVRELEVATGRVREPVPGVAVQFESHPFTPPGMRKLVAKNPERVWFYDLRSAEAVLVSSGAEPCGYLGTSTSLEQVVLWDSGAFVLWDVPSNQRWRLPPTKAVRVLPDGSGAVFLDAEGGAWGWRPGQEPVRLGTSRATSYCGIESYPVQAASSGAVLFIGTDGEATLWNPRTRQVRAVGSQVKSGQLSASGEHVALVHQPPEQELFVTVQTPATGTRWTVWRGEGRVGMNLSKDGRRLALSVRVHPFGYDPSENYQAIRLWNVETGDEVSLRPEPPSTRFGSPHFSFHHDSGLLHVSMGDGDRMYSARDGEQLFFTDKATTQGEGNYFYWGPGDRFYARAGAYMPPDRGLYMWDPRTGVETEVADANKLVCFLDGGPVLRTGNEYDLETTTASLVHWNPDTHHLETLASTSVPGGTRCLQERGVVVTYEDWQTPEWQFWDGHGTLTVMEPKRHCRWQVDTEVKHDLTVDVGLVYQARGQVWRARLP